MKEENVILVNTNDEQIGLMPKNGSPRESSLAPGIFGFCIE